MPLWLCLRFNALPIEALLKKYSIEASIANVVIENHKVIACDNLSNLNGVEAGQSLNTVKVLLKGQKVRFHKRDCEAERETLDLIISWVYSLSPILQAWQNDALLIEIGCCLKLHGGLKNLLEHIKVEMTRRNLSVGIGVAQTKDAAYLLSFTDEFIGCHPERNLIERLAILPITLLNEEFHPLIKRLEAAGILNFGKLLEIPLPALGRRCGVEFVDWLNRLTGRNREPLNEHKPAVQFQDSLWFGFEIKNKQELQPAMKELLANFCHFLKKKQLISNTIEWHLLHIHGENRRLKVLSESALKNAQSWLDLSSLRLENVDIPDGIEGLSLIAEYLYESEASCQDLFGNGINEISRYQLVDRLKSRLGLYAVGYLGYCSENLPEESIIETTSPYSGFRVEHDILKQRPFWLFSKPHPIQQKGKELIWNGPLKIVYGPERIEDKWWDIPTSRDYYIAHNRQKQPIWIYQDRYSRRWYVHGLFS